MERTLFAISQSLTLEGRDCIPFNCLYRPLLHTFAVLDALQTTITMKIRARLKTLEELPDWMFCCPRMEQDLVSNQGKVLVVNSYPTTPLPLTFCSYCNQQHKLTVGKWSEDGRMVIPVEVYDLDEGEYDPNQDVSQTARTDPPRERTA
jgi:hypothetical protein